MAKALAVKKPERGGRALGKVGDYRAELAKYAKEDSSRLPSSAGNYISIRGKNFSFQGAILEEPLKAAVIDYGFENALYEGPFDEENPQPPVCFAVAKTAEELAPHPDSPKPQSEQCKGCPHNDWGTADTGTGKACKNSLRLALLSTETKKFDADFVAKTPPALMRLPPTSLKHFKGYLKKITEGLQLPLFSVITAFSFDEEKATPVVIPQFEEELDDRALARALVQKREEVQEELLRPFDVSNYSETSIKKTKKQKPAKLKPKISNTVARKSKF